MHNALICCVVRELFERCLNEAFVRQKRGISDNFGSVKRLVYLCNVQTRKRKTMERQYKMPAIAWLQVTEYMRGWLVFELGGRVRAHYKPVISVQHLPGARDILRMEAFEDLMEPGPTGRAMSATRMNCLCAGMAMDPNAVERLYGVTKESIETYVPIECPKMCLTKYGVLRPWTLDIGFGKQQAMAMQQLLRREFWLAVEEFDRLYAVEVDGEWYAAKDMVEEFCSRHGTPDVYVEAIRREWQRRVKKEKDAGKQGE